MMNLTEKGKEFQEWLSQLQQITADKTGKELWEIKINSDEAYKWFKDGFTPVQCFRETWSTENDLV